MIDLTTKKAFTDEEYFKLSEAVYQDGTLNSKKINIELSDRTKRNWKVVSKLNDKATDTQAFAVISEKKEKMVESLITIIIWFLFIEEQKSQKISVAIL